MPLSNRKYFEGNGYYITTSVKKFIKIFRERKYIDIILENLNFYRKKYGFKLIGYVIMPNHLHLMIYPDQKRVAEISRFIEDFKKFTSKKLRELMEKNKKSGWLKLFRLSDDKKKNWRYQIWQPGFDDLGVYSPKVVRTKLNYIHNNPVRAGLAERPEDYLYSSARNFILNDHSVIKVDTDLLSF
ncbi:MAG: transposase [candidate division Zixibacteria bacterium]|nr:transposase [candidate division Zixibacteria bacterium]